MADVKQIERSLKSAIVAREVIGALKFNAERYFAVTIPDIMSWILLWIVNQLFSDRYNWMKGEFYYERLLPQKSHKNENLRRRSL